MPLVGKVAFVEQYGPYALIAGGSDGLGYAFAEAAARRGLGLILVARDTERLQAAAVRLKQAYHVDVIPMVADLAFTDDVVARIVAIPREIGLLVYNAAYCPVGPLSHRTDAELSRVVAVNARTPLLLARRLSEPMIGRGKGGIVLMSSLAGAQGSPRLVAYGATKSFLVTLAEGLWSELRRSGVDVIACVAGAVTTPGYEQTGQGGRAPGALPPGDVAEQTLDALGHGPVVVPGGFNKFGRFILSRVLSRKGAIWLMSRNTGGLM